MLFRAFCIEQTNATTGALSDSCPSTYQYHASWKTVWRPALGDNHRRHATLTYTTPLHCFSFGSSIRVQPTLALILLATHAPPSLTTESPIGGGRGTFQTGTVLEYRAGPRH